MQPIMFIDWLNTAERVFDYYEPLEHKKVKLVLLSCIRILFFWWENLKRQRDREGVLSAKDWDTLHLNVLIGK